MTIHRLTTFEQMFLRLETPAWPGHVAGLALVDAEPLLDARGELDVARIRERIGRRVSTVPALRRRLRVTPPGLGRSVWTQHGSVDVAHHVRQVTIARPGGRRELLAAVDQVHGRLLDRSRPLWELWLLTGLGDGSIGVLLKLHHAVADGIAAVAVLAAMLDDRPDAPDPAPPPTARSAAPQDPAPDASALLADRVAAVRTALHRATAALRSPDDVVQRVRFVLRVLRHMGGQQAPRTSLNHPVVAGRRLGHVAVGLDEAKWAAHAHGGRINDLVLAAWTGGLRRLLASRGEPVDHLELVDGMSVTLRPSTTAADSVDNRVGTAVVRLPVWQADPRRRLEEIVRRTTAARDDQAPAVVVAPLALLAGTPLGRWYVARQRASNVISTNVVGPPVPLYLLGARVRSMLPILALQGNIGLSICALSYAGRLVLAVTADARRFPDLDVLVAGMEDDLRVLLDGAGDAAPRTAPSPTRAGSPTSDGAEPQVALRRDRGVPP